jgi:hypothetical protein
MLATGLALSGGAAFAAGDLSATDAPAPANQKPGTIGLVLGTWRYALYETPNGKDECPEGFQFKQAQNFAAQFPTDAAKKAHGEQFGYYANRGPHGENVFYFPMSVEDPLPFRAVHGDVGLGLNLDGDDTGKGGGLSLPHGNFKSPDGAAGVDNQLYRVIGCTPGWRKGGMIDGIVSQYMRSETQARLLLEVTGVDNELNDDDVTITTYRGRDPVATDTKDKLIPWLSQRIDYKSGGRYVQRLKGKIVNGVLITDPADVRLPSYEQPDMAGDRNIKRMQLRVKLTPSGADGMLGGYVDLENWYLMYAKTWGAHSIADVQGWSAPATYRALKQFADYRDPKTGEADAISAAYEVGFARTFIVHTQQGDAVVAEALPNLSTPSLSTPASARRTASR